MGLYNFNPQFEQAILNRTKLTTIRGVRKHADGPGDTMHLYCGLRTKQSRLLGRVRCVERQDISISDWFGVRIDSEVLRPYEIDDLFECDGFPGGAAEALSFFKSRLPFTGHLYRWSWD